MRQSSAVRKSDISFVEVIEPNLNHDIKLANLASANEHIEHAELAFAQGRHVEGEALALSALKACESLDDLELTARATLQLASHRWRLGQFESAIVLARSAADLWSTLGGPRQCDALNLLAISCSEIGLQDEALRAALDAFEHARAGNWQLQMIEGLSRIGICYDRAGNPKQAEVFLLEALEMSKASGSENHMLASFNSLAVAGVSFFYLAAPGTTSQTRQLDLRRFTNYAEEAVALAGKLADPYRLAVTLGNLGEMRGLLDEFEASFAALEQSLDLAKQHNYRAIALRARVTHAEILLRQAPNSAAIDELVAVLDEMRPGDQEATHLRLHSGLHRAFKNLGRYEEALLHAEEAHRLEAARTMGQAAAQARMMVNRVEIELEKIESERARLEAKVQRSNNRELLAEKQALEAKAAKLHRDTLQDGLTTLGNRRRVDAELPALLELAGKPGHSVCIVLADLDRFKLVNDRFGHVTGDAVLRAVAGIFSSKTRSNKLLARIGGEEFLFAMTDTSMSDAKLICERVRIAIEDYPWHQIANGLSVTISLGICLLSESASQSEALERADRALYDAKRSGRNRVVMLGA